MQIIQILKIMRSTQIIRILKIMHSAQIIQILKIMPVDSQLTKIAPTVCIYEIFRCVERPKRAYNGSNK